MTDTAATEGVIVALGARRDVDAFSLAGVEVRAAEDAAAVRAAWAALGDEVGLVLLTADAAEALGNVIDATASPLTAVLPS